MDTVAPRDTAKAAKSAPPKPADETVDIYVWKPANGVQAKPAKASPAREPVVVASGAPSWARIGRVFLAGLIMGVAGYKAVQLIFRKDHA